MLSLLAGCASSAASADSGEAGTSTTTSETSSAATPASAGATGATTGSGRPRATDVGEAVTSGSGTVGSSSTSGLEDTGTQDDGSSGPERGETTTSSGVGSSSTGDGPIVPLVTVFESFTEAAGLDMPHDCVYEAQYPPGIGVRDFDGDGHQDLFLTSWEGPSRLWLGDGAGSFAEAAQGGILADHTSTGVAVGDYDNDGRPDVFVSGTSAGALLRDSDGSLVNVTGTTGVASSIEGTAGAWGDYDGDGDLDLFAGAWNGETLVDSQELFRNNGDGTFSDVSALLDVSVAGRPVLAASFLDYDNDGDSDLYVVIDKSHGNVLWRNDGPGCGGWCFTDVAEDAGAALQINGMGIAVTDYDNDGDLDLYMTDILAAYLLQNQTAQGEPVFVDVTGEAGVHIPGVAWGALFFDYDNDGWQDLYVAQGQPGGGPFSANIMFRNLGDGTFDGLGSASGALDMGFSQAVAYQDFDEDGFLDLVVGNRQDAYALYRNKGDFGSDNNWIEVDLRGVAPVTSDAAGARAWISTDDGVTQLQEVKLGSSMSSTNMLPLHFGLGANDGALLSVLWPDGETAAFTLESADLNQRVIVTYPGVLASK
ncbi:MAG: CRTAC1 family protein [Nannocystaceae bacterium]|nr:CRTAC1 family protein [Nannocystaceae bacterium]